MKKGIILDTNCFSHVFSITDKKHPEFAPILDWLMKKEGHLVYGGKHYLKELAQSKRYAYLFNQLRDNGKLIRVDDDKVNNEEVRVMSLIQNPDFDDPHLVAIVIISGCRIICTEDARSCPYLKNKTLYPKSKMRPKFYTGVRNLKLLNSRYTNL